MILLGIKFIVAQVMIEFREIGKLDPSETRDTSGIKNMSQFLAEIAQRLPELIIPNISVLLVHLDGEVRFTTFEFL